MSQAPPTVPLGHWEDLFVERMSEQVLMHLRSALHQAPMRRPQADWRSPLPFPWGPAIRHLAQTV